MKNFTKKQLVAETKKITKGYSDESLQYALTVEIVARLEDILRSCGVSLDDTTKVNYLISSCERWREEIKPNIDLQKIIVQKHHRNELEELIKIITPREFLWMIAEAKNRHDRQTTLTKLNNVFRELTYKQMDYVVDLLHDAPDSYKAIPMPQLKNSRHREVIDSCINDYGVLHVACEARRFYYDLIQEKVGIQLAKFAQSPEAGYAAGVRAITGIASQRRKALEKNI